MKKFTFLSLVALLSFSSYAQTVPTKKMAFFAKKTATWCNPCGTWAWDLFDDVYNRVGGEAFVSAEMHISTSSVLASGAANTMYDYMEQRSSTPVFYVNSINQTQYSSTGGIYTGSTKTRVFEVIDSIGLTDADINSAFTASITNNDITVNTKTEVFNATTGDFYLGVYLVEKDVVAYQNGIGNSASHKIVFRDNISTNVMGDLVSSGAVSPGATFNNVFNFTVPATYDVSKLQVFVVLWNKVGTDYNFESAYSDFQYLSTTPIGKIEELAIDVSAYQSQDILHYQLQNNTSNEKMTVDLINVNGQIVKTIYEGIPDNNLEIKTSVADLPKGVYFVRTNIKDQSKTIKIIL
jgi:hypothetical protein